MNRKLQGALLVSPAVLMFVGMAAVDFKAFLFAVACAVIVGLPLVGIIVAFFLGMYYLTEKDDR